MGVVNFTPAPGGGGGENVFPWRFTSDIVTNVTTDDFAVYLQTSLDDTLYEINLPAVPGGEKLFQVGINQPINSGCQLQINAPAGGSINGLGSILFDQSFQGILVQSVGISGTTYLIIAYNSNSPSVPSLQAVTNVGNTTTNTVSMRGLFLTAITTHSTGAPPLIIDNNMSTIIVNMQGASSTFLSAVLPNNAGFIGRIYKMYFLRDIAFTSVYCEITVAGGGTINGISSSRLSLRNEVHEYQCIAAGVWIRTPYLRVYSARYAFTYGAPASILEAAQNELTVVPINGNINAADNVTRAAVDAAGGFFPLLSSNAFVWAQTNVNVPAGTYTWNTTIYSAV